MPPDETVWPLDPHTEGKHKVLQRYLQAWLPIMTSRNKRILFIDAFAGPGIYKGGQPGSPVIALRALAEHSARDRMQCEVRYFFIESRQDRCKRLEQVLLGWNEKLPSGCRYHVENSKFDETMTDALDYVDQQQSRMAPAFVMIDPFGVSDTPMSIVGRILKNPSSEVFVSFMYRDINRFRRHPNFETGLDSLFGCGDWRVGIDMADGRERKEFFYDLYRGQLKKNGARFVSQFELYDGNKLIYAIFFGTSDLLGCDKMKEAIWKIDPFGGCKFRGGEHDQLLFDDGIAELSLFRADLQQQFGSQGWKEIKEVVDFARSDATVFHSGQLKKRTLKPMEDEGLIEVMHGSRKRAGTYPDGTLLRFC